MKERPILFSGENICPPKNAPGAPFAIETVSEYDVYLKGKGYTK